MKAQPLRLKAKQSEGGFTFVELAITMAVVVLCLVGYLGSNIAIQHSEEKAFERTVALQDASRVIEQMRNASENGQFPGNVTGAFPNNAVIGGFNNLQQEQVTVNYVNAASDPLDATVTVTWMEKGRRQVDVALRTLITQRT